MQIIDTLISAKWVLPIAPKNTVLTDHSVAIHQGKIIDLLPTSEAKQKYQADQHHQLDHHAVMPGLINTHTHSAMTLLRGLADDLPLMDWLTNHMWPAEEKFMDANAIELGSELAIAEMLRGGITCFNDLYFFPQHTAKIATNIGIRATLGLPIMDVPTLWAKDSQESLDKGLAIYKDFDQHPLINWALGPHSPYTCNDETLKKILATSEKHDLRIHIHLHESINEIEQGLEQSGVRPMERLNQLGLLNSKLMTAHMVHLTSEEIELAAATGIHILHCPEANLKLANGIAPIAALKHAGANVALGTDGPASNNDLDFFSEMRTASLVSKGSTFEATALPALEVLEMATLSGAKALGLEHSIGSLEVGKDADLISIDLNHLNTSPVYHPHSQIIYSANRLQVDDVWVMGKQLLSQGRLSAINTTDLIQKAQQWSNKLC